MEMEQKKNVDMHHKERVKKTMKQREEECNAQDNNHNLFCGDEKGEGYDQLQGIFSFL